MTVSGRPTIEQRLSDNRGLARFMGAVLDAVDVETVGGFWAAVLRGTIVRAESGRRRVDTSLDRPENEILWINPVRDLPTVKTRVHFDLRLGGETPDALLRAGARLIRRPGRDPWYVLADPEGNAFCAFPSEPSSRPGIFELVVDSRDAHAQGRWWAMVLGGRVEEEGRAAAVTDAPSLPWEYLVFDAVPEPKVLPNRMRWHLEMLQADPADLVAAGATIVNAPSDGTERFWTLADPEGNEFHAHVRP